MKKKRVLIMTLAVALAFTTGVFARNAFDIIKAEIRTDFVIEIDGEVREFENAQGERVYPILHNGTTYLPVRAIGEIMGKTVYWYEDDKIIKLKDGKPTVTDADVIVLEEKRKENKASGESAGFISPERAKEIALEKAGFAADDVHFKKAKLDEDDGVWLYEIEFKTGGVEHEFEIGAVNGAILSWEIDKDDDDDHKIHDDLISKEKAKEIVLNKAGLTEDAVRFEKIELDEDDGILKYEIEFEKGETEYEAEIDAKTGEILKWETDIDD